MTRISAYASPLIGQTVGGDIDPDVLARNALIQQGQENGLLPTMGDPSQPIAIQMQPFQDYLNGQGNLDTGLQSTPSGSDLPATPESPKPMDFFDKMLKYQTDAKMYENSEEVMGRKNKYALELMNAIGDRQQKYGLQSQLVGFALNKLPDMLSAGARNRNYYLDQLVSKTPAIGQAASSMYTGAGTGNYFGRGV